jgi:CopG family transcriptional regulator/antitoxin EndoAI
VALLAGIKRIMISLPESLLEEVDGLATVERRNRSEFIREAMKLYISERKRYTIREQMKLGYQEMAHINLALALEQMDADRDLQELFEDKLAECK